MISTVTGATIAAVSAVSESALLGTIAVIALIMIMICREVTAAADPRRQKVTRYLIVAIVPLLVVFAIIVIGHIIPYL